MSLSQVALYVIFVAGIALVASGTIKIKKTLKKANMVQCTFCNEIMDKNLYNQHAAKHIKTEEQENKKIQFKTWVLNEVDKRKEFVREDLVKEGAKAIDIPITVARRYLQEMVLGKQKLGIFQVCNSCGYTGDVERVKSCVKCKRFFCELCMEDHGCNNKSEELKK